MHEKENLPFEEYLIKIYQQNKRIIELLERGVVEPQSSDPPKKTEEQKLNIEKMDSLSPREHQIISLILDGKLNKEIAHEFSISLSTVEAHRSNIMRKLDAKNVAQLIKTYLQCQE